MRTIDIPGKHLGWRALAIVALAAAMLALADGAMAKKKKPFKTGTFVGEAADTPGGRGIQLDVKKKKVTVVFLGWKSCSPPLGDPGGTPTGGEPAYAGLTGEIKVKKVGAIAFGPGRKRVGTFDVDAPNGGVVGYIKGKKAEGIATNLDTCPDGIDWEAKRTGPSFF